MPPLTRDQFQRALKQGPPASAYYFVGPEDLLKDAAVGQLIELTVDAGVRDFNVDTASAAGLDAEQVETLCSTLPMMAERRVVVIRDVEQWRANARGRKMLLAYLERPSPETVLILVQGSGDPEPDPAIAAKTACVLFDRLPADRALKWLQIEVKALGVTLPDDAARHLITAVETEQGIDLGVLRTEAAKLAAIPNDVPITVELVGGLVGVRHGETPNDWLVAVLDDDVPRALALIEPVLASTSGVRLVMLLGTALCGVQFARALRDNPQRRGGLEGALFAAFKQHNLRGFGSWAEAARLWSAAAERWTPERLDAALRATLRADERLKSTTLGDDATILRDLVLRLGARRASKAA
jgi:DNA polymerase-3 subunit delta